MYCRVDGNFSYIYLKDDQCKEYIFYFLGKMEELLLVQLFFWIYVFYIINCNFIKKYIIRDGGYLIMKDGIKFFVVKSWKFEFDNWFGFKDSQVVFLDRYIENDDNCFMFFFFF